MTKKQFLLTASVLTAMAFTLSCSDSNNDGGGSNITEAYTLSIDEDSFTYTEKEEWYECEEGGELESYSYDSKRTVNYSIANNVLEWKRYSDTLNFKGTSKNLIGTWTRTKNKDTSCELNRYADYYECKEDWDVIKAEFTESSVKITRDYCASDREVDGSEWDGWTLKITGCETGEYRKGSETIKIQETQSSFKITYNGKTCSYSEPSVSQQRTACQKAWTEYSNEGGYLEDYYDDYLYADFYECIKSVPLFGYYDDDDYYYKSLAKKGAKFSALKRAKQ